MGFQWRMEHFIKNTVDTITDHKVPFERLNVYIAGALLVTLGDQAVDKTDDRRFVRGIDQIRWFQVADQVSGCLLLDFLDHLAGVSGLFFIAAIDGAQNFFRSCDAGLDVLPGQSAQIVERTGVHGVGNGHLQTAVEPLQRVDTVFLGKANRNDIEQILGCRFLGNRLQVGQLELNRQCLGQNHAVQNFQLDEDLTEALAALQLFRQGRVNPLLINLEILLQYFTYTPPVMHAELLPGKMG